MPFLDSGGQHGFFSSEGKMDSTGNRMDQPVIHARGVGRLALILMVIGLVFMPGCNDKGTAVEPPPEVQDGVLYDVAGQTGQSGDDGEEGPAVNALLYWPQDMTPLPNGDLLVMDWNNHRIRRITPDGIIHHFIGSGHLGDVRTGDAINARFNHPTEIKVGPNGNYWIATYHNWCIKEVDATTMTFVQVIGDTTRGYRGDYPENGGSIDATATPRFDLPSSLVFDPAGNLYFSDQGNTRIRKIDLQARVISSFVGGTRGDRDGIGEQAQFALPGAQTTGTGDRGGSIDISPDGTTIYMVDTENHKVKTIDIATRMVTTIAGTGEPGYEGDGGQALVAQFNFPQDIACAANGDLYIADSHNHVIRKISATGIVTTVAGTGSPGSSPNATPAHEAKLKQPIGVAYDNVTNTLYIADTYNNQIKKVRNP
jgi:sugar lactone lactonase YvrE